MVTAKPKVLKKKPYRGHYPSATRYLMEEDVTSIPRQYEREIHWAYGVDIVYTLRHMTPANFAKYADSLLLLAYQEAKRYDEFGYKFAGFDVRLGRSRKGRDLQEVITFQAAMNPDADVMVYGEEALGYTVPQKYFLINKVRDILDLGRRYPEKLIKQAPYKVLRLFIGIRERK